MFRASRAVALARKSGEPLPHVPFLKDLYAAGNEIYRGSLVMVAGTPGSSKSMFALNLVHHMGLPTLYCSADSDAATQTSRLAAMTTGVVAGSIRKGIAEDDAQAERFKKELDGSNIQWCFDSNPDAFDIRDEISAWVELYDAYPEVIVVDNLRNVFSGAENEHSGYKAVQQALIDITRETGACIITMHHMKEAASRKSTDPAPRHAIDGMVAQLPAQIFSVAREDNEFRLCVVKDREAANDPEAREQSWHRLTSDPTTSTFHYLRGVQPKANELGEAMADRGWRDVPLDGDQEGW